MILNKLKSAGRNAFDRMVEARKREAARRIEAIRASRNDF